MVKNPQDTFWWKDWEEDPVLKLCSLAAQGLWMRLLCVAAKSEPYGYVLIEGRVPSHDDLAVLIGRPVAEVTPLIEELGRREVYSVDAKGRIYNRRMVKKARERAIAIKNGKKGGNPNLRKTTENSEGVNPSTTPPVKPNTSTVSTPSTELPLSDANASDRPPDDGQADLLGSMAKPKTKSTKRGSRIPDDWAPSPDDHLFARQQGLTDVRIKQLSDEFLDYWRAVPGQRGVKLDWSATFRNRVRAIVERDGRGFPPRPGGSRSPGNRPAHGGAAAAARAILGEGTEDAGSDERTGLRPRPTDRLRLVF